MSNPELVSYSEEFFPSYSAFAEKNWGKGCFQASAKFLDWHYRENPGHERGFADFLVAVKDGLVIGAMHKTRLSWRISEGQVEDVPALHNWMVDDEHRKGVGFLILNRSLRGDPHVFIPAAADNLSTIYRGLKCQELAPRWYRKILAPVRGAFALGGKMLGQREDLAGLSHRFAAIADADFGERTITTRPSDELIEQMARKLAGQLSEGAGPVWDAPMLRWRCFHPRGPRHLFVGIKRGGELSGFLIVSLGKKKGMGVARLIEAAADSLETFQELMALAEKSVKRAGADVFLIFSARVRIQQFLEASGWKALKNGPPCFLHHTNRKQLFPPVAISGAVADFGFEAILLQVEEARPHSPALPLAQFADGKQSL